MVFLVADGFSMLFSVFQDIVDIAVSAVHSLVSFFANMVSAMDYVFELVSFMPSEITVYAIAILTTSIILLVVGRN